ncbi:MAG: toll/interleukin-1 receptor domain-containing protein [Propionivibrio sp.]|nr:toll/interleukin-1 receptor domain-containing protein [Propionivibrio sp.]
MPGLFISYRRDDQAGFAGRLADALGSAFGEDNVFRDIEDIRPGDDFVVALQKQLHGVGVMLVMIGPAWLTTSKNGVRRLDDPGDFVRLEIQAGLESGKPVIPVLVGGALMPAESDLPPALAGLARRQAVVLSDAGWRSDVERLVTSLRDLLPGLGNRKTVTRTGGLILAGVTVLVLLALFAAMRYLPEKAGSSQPMAVITQQSAAEIAGRWTARVKYAWGDEYQEVFEFKMLGKQLHGSASYLSSRLTIEQASLEDGWLRFITRSREMLGSDSPWKDVTHRYTGQVTPEGIRFTLESSGGYTLNPALEFVATRASP